MDDFSFREMECFVAVAEELSFTRGAKRLHMAQPPLSRHIRNLEEKLGEPLFERGSRRVSLTGAGEVFLREVREILLQVRRAGESVRRLGQGETRKLEVGFVSAVLSPEMVGIFSRFRAKHPDVQLNLRDRLPSEQLVNLEEGNLDVGFIGVAPEKLPRGIATTRWMDERLYAFIPPLHDLADRTLIRLSSLKDEPFVMVSQEAAPAFVAKIQDFCTEEQFRLKPIQEASRAQAVAAMTVAGSGVSLLPASLNRVTGNGIPLLRSRNRNAVITHTVAHAESPSELVQRFLEELSRN